MVTFPARRVLLRWMFDALGFLLVFGGNFVVRSVLHADFWAGMLFGTGTAGFQFLLAVHLYVLVTGVLCWLAASGLKRGKTWLRPVGVCTCALLIMGFPWLTIAGGIGLYLLADPSSRPDPAAAPAPAPARPTTDFWNSKRKSKAQAVALTILWIFFAPLGGLLGTYAHRAGMPEWNPGWMFWVWFTVFLLVNTALHESGHAIVAWAAGFQVRIVSIGPLTFWRERASSPFQCRFDLGRLFERGGYTGAVPVSDLHLRHYEIAVIAAGPIANALTCLVCLAVFFSLPGTAWQGWWWVAAFNAALAGLFVVSNLIPLGYCDGTMLLHLVFWTPQGRLLLERNRSMQLEAEAGVCHDQADFAREIELKKAMLERNLAFGQDNAFMIAACHQALGTAHMLLDDWPAAEFHFRRCLEFEAELAQNPALEGNARSGLLFTVTGRQHPAGTGPAYAAALAILEKRKAANDSPAGPAVTHAMLAQSHIRARAFQAALGEIEPGLKSLPPGPGGDQSRGRLFRAKAVCFVNLGDVPAGLAAAQASADFFRSPGIPPGARNLAWENVADLGDQLWTAGQSSLPIDLLREAIAQLESGGAALVAAQYRIKLACAYRHLGQPDEARAVLPTEGGLPPAVRRAFLSERAQLHLVCGHPDLAVADCRELVALWRAHPRTPAPEIASAEALLAAACLAAGNAAEASALATQAAEVLGPWQHPDAASCLVTLAIAQAQPALIDEAFRLIESALLLGPAEKTRLKSVETARIQRSSAAAPAVAS